MACAVFHNISLILNDQLEDDEEIENWIMKFRWVWSSFIINLKKVFSYEMFSLNDCSDKIYIMPYICIYIYYIISYVIY